MLDPGDLRGFSYLCDQDVGLSLFLGDLDHLHGEVFLKASHFLGGVVQNVETLLVPVDVPFNQGDVLTEHLLVEGNELQEGLWGGVVESPFVLEVQLIGLVDGHVDFGHVVGQSDLDVVVDVLDVLDELGGHTLQGVSWPTVEPIHGAGVNKSGELSGLDPHVLSYRREAKDQLEVLPHFIKEVLPQLVLLVRHSGALGLVP